MTSTASLLLALLLPGPAHAADPCDGLRVGAGAVSTGLRLPDQPTLAEPIAGCVAAIGERLAELPGLRTVTVAVRVDEQRRATGEGRRIADAYVQALVGAGLSAARVSSIVPAAAAGQPATVVLTYAERPAGPSVAVIDSASGSVAAGASPAQLEPVSSGQALPAQRFVQTGLSSTALLGLADGSWVKVKPSSLVLVGDLRVDAKLQRVVSLEVLTGGVEAAVSKSTGGSFEVSTRAGIAGVRGTEFRVHADGDAAARVETTEGVVALAGDAGEPEVLTEARGSQVAAGQAPEPARDLLAPPAIVGPVKGQLPASGLRWKKVKGAERYVVEIARDAELVHDVVEASTQPEGLQPALGDGRWFWRVAAVDADGFVGMWSKVYGFDAATDG